MDRIEVVSGCVVLLCIVVTRWRTLGRGTTDEKGRRFGGVLVIGKETSFFHTYYLLLFYYYLLLLLLLLATSSSNC